MSVARHAAVATALAVLAAAVPVAGQTTSALEGAWTVARATDANSRFQIEEEPMLGADVGVEHAALRSFAAPVLDAL